MRIALRSIFYVSLLITCSSCSIQNPLIEQSTIRSTQFENKAMPTQITPINLPSSGSQRLRSVVGQKHVIQIVSNPSTGYRWEMSFEEPAKKCLDVLSTNMIYDDKQDVVDGLRRPGAPGKQEWLLQTNCVGHYRVIFVYKRPWEGGPPSNQTIIEFVTIKE